MKVFNRYLLYLAVVFVALPVLLTGCSRGAGALDRREEQDPLVKRARVKKRAKDIDGAIELFNKALERRPRLARPHLELGLLYDGYKEDYVRALYHYQRYLEARPDTEKKKLIEDLIRRVRISFAATLPETPSGAIEEISELKRENRALKARFARLEGAEPEVVAVVEKQPAPVHRTRPAPVLVTPEPAPAQAAVQTYRVQRGDSLSSIAAKMYDNSTAWKKIFEANQASMKRPESIRVGQTLIIPR